MVDAGAALGHEGKLDQHARRLDQRMRPRMHLADGAGPALMGGKAHDRCRSATSVNSSLAGSATIGLLQNHKLRYRYDVRAHRNAMCDVVAPCRGAFSLSMKRLARPLCVELDK